MRLHVEDVLDFLMMDVEQLGTQQVVLLDGQNEQNVVNQLRMHHKFTSYPPEIAEM